MAFYILTVHATASSSPALESLQSNDLVTWSINFKFPPCIYAGQPMRKLDSESSAMIGRPAGKFMEESWNW